MADRLHSTFTTSDGIHTAIAWMLDGHPDMLSTRPPDDIGKIARAVRPGSHTHVNGLVDLYGGDPNDTPVYYVAGDVLALYPFLAPEGGASQYTVLEVIPGSFFGVGVAQRLRVQALNAGAPYALLPGENTLDQPRTGFSSHVQVIGDGVVLSYARYYVLHDVADGSNVWHEVRTIDPNAEPDPVPITIEQHANIAPGYRHPIHFWEVGAYVELFDLPTLSSDVGRVARVGVDPSTFYAFCGAGGDTAQIWRQLDQEPSDPGGPSLALSSTPPTTISAYHEQTGEGDPVITGQASPGSEDAAAHGDHAHAIATGPAIELSLYSRNAEGEGPELARAAHSHDIRAAVLAQITQVSGSVTIGAVIGPPTTYVRFTSASAGTITMDTDAAMATAHSEELPVGWPLTLVQAGTGKLTLAAAPGVTLSPPGPHSARAQGSWIVLVKVGANTWDVSGDLE